MLHVVKITFLMDGFDIGGTELNATRTLESFGRRGLLVDVMHFHADGPLRSRILAAGHRLTYVPISPLSSPRILSRVLALAAAIRAAGATAVHTQDVYSNILGVAAARVLLRRAVITSRRWKDDVPRKALTPMNAWAHRHSALVLPNSLALVPTLQSEGVADSRIAVHENFIDDAALTLLPEEARQAWRRAVGVRDSAVVVGCVARLSRVKRHDVLLDAFAIARRAVPDMQLLLVGDGDMRTAISEQARQLGIMRDLIFTGTLPNSPLPQQLFDIAVLTSENEGFPNSLVEASACGVPLIATPVGGTTDVLLDDRTGILVSVNDSASTASAITALAHDRTRRERYGAAARKEVTARFSETAAIDRLLTLYRRVSA